MTMTPIKAPPIVSLQAPKDVSIDQIEAELSQIWESYRETGDNGDFPVATRATTFTFVVYEPEETQQLLAALGFYLGPIDGISGPLTAAGVRAAQKAYGMPRTGKTNAELLERLREDFTKKSLNGGLEDGSVAASSSLNASGTGIADAIASANPCRIIALCPTAGEDRGVTAQVSAYCPVHKRSSSTLICCEYITLRGAEAALERVSAIVSALMIEDLPKFLWWKATPDADLALFQRLAAASSSVIVDSSCFAQPETELLEMQNLKDQGIPIADLNWRRLAPWQELTAEAYDPPERRAAIGEIDRVTIDYEKGNSSQALMFLGWLASRLQWHPLSSQQEEGDYQIKRIQFAGPEGRQIEAELAAIPTADTGDVQGDLIALRLNSTNEKADCGTVLCSETGGCMRMESHGGAQTGRINQVTPLFDQQTEQLLSQHLQRWGRDMLYEESLAVTAQILKLVNG
ncbi:glucose-6-phosphate dehydrogenase assembly protein OpcA [Kamptonema animale CS-326]|jgi:glucose-6-phosphate dehydrogenase assembly protein OpcA|uniref:glucose-6-phosphate dehydrogenase assembly protein OpcA n=1 Tax=Kamptonema animale TaxID=92934 RepID=UPI00232BB7BA|nr:glucose-6-phosphate dehydrogenase assembly protein OpcA [Kamptonema animale]MDB9511898.1 glucose-6-phosphate dehydrogenase assembly protein OpcA [Kamptonema animale CS-326]